MIRSDLSEKDTSDGASVSLSTTVVVVVVVVFLTRRMISDCEAVSSSAVGSPGK